MLFAANGYDRTTIRDIAQTAAINPALVIRYYGSKEALFAEVATLRFEAEPIHDLPRERLGQAIVSHVMSRWEHPEQGSAQVAMLRAAIAGESAQARINAMFAQQLQALFTAVGVDQKSPQTGALIATQMLGLGVARYVLRMPPVVQLPKQIVIEQVGRVVQQYIDAALGEGGADP